MAGPYRFVGWNRQKRLYDTTLGLTLATVVAGFAGATMLTNTAPTIETLVIRSTAISAFLLLHVIVCIGPLARLDPRFLPLLYNRRHLGVTLFFIALIHAIFATVQFHLLGDVNPLVSIFTAYQQDYTPGIGRISHFPFEPFGFFALVILFLMAATSHDFWLRLLGASTWKTLHITVYVAYGFLVLHVAFGFLQSERHPLLALLVFAGFVTVSVLHLAAHTKEVGRDRRRSESSEGYHFACGVEELREGQGRVFTVYKERRAVFRHQDKVFALSNVCRHQGGPIGEGRILDGCVTCPWHGWQYRPETGTSPPPFHEVIDTYPVRIVDGKVYVAAEPNAPGAVCPGVPVEGGSGS